MREFNIKQGDRLPVLDATLQNRSGTPIDLTTAVSVTFRMWQRGATSFAVNAAATIVVAANGTVRYSWGASDTLVIGRYLAEFVITFSGSRNQTTPTAGTFFVNVIDAGLAG